MKKRWNFRLAVQAVFFALVALIAINHSLGEFGRAIPVLSSASLHALCPFGGVVSIYQFASTGSYVRKIHESAFILMGIGFLVALLFGAAFCGWICPFGSIQEWLGTLGRKIFRRKFNRLIPHRFDTLLRYLRYFVLVWVLLMTILTGKLFFSDIDPYFALFNFWTAEAATAGLIILGVVLLLSVFVERPFCKYACPYGAVLGLFNLVRMIKIRRNNPACIQCKRCDDLCPMNIKVSEKAIVRNHQCITCMECTSEKNCPVKETVVLSSVRFPKEVVS